MQSARNILQTTTSLATLGTLALLAVLVLAASQPVRAQTTENVVYSFTGGLDGKHPYAGVVRDAHGNLYGTTIQGGAYAYGVVFKLDGSGKETVLFNFPANGGEAALPTGLTKDRLGNLYGTTYAGGAYGKGSVFKLDAGGNLTVLYSFTGGTDGGEPQAAVLPDKQGNLYGTAEQGGNVGSCYQAGCGTVFKLDATGHETVLYSFTGTGGDGFWPCADLLVRDGHGNLYGTTLQGGAYGGTYGYGTVFKVDATGKETVLHSFTETGGDGANPYAGLVRDAHGNLYGTTTWGGLFGYGMVFKLDPKGNETVLHSFEGSGGDGADPYAGLLLDPHGNLYGTTGAGGAFASGTVFKLDPSGNETVLYSFKGSGGDGSYPAAGLVMDKKGNLYGTTVDGGAYDQGTVFKLTP